MKNLELQLRDLQEENKRLKARQSESANDGDIARREVLLTESGLPAPAVARLKKKYVAAKVTELVEAIAAEKDYIRKVRSSSTSSGGGDAGKARLQEAYRGLGMDPEQARIASNDLEQAADFVSESESRLREASKLMLGLSDREAAAFSKRRY
jgi:hypothetical protein